VSAVTAGGLLDSSKRKAPTLYSVKNPLRGIDDVSTSKSVIALPFTSCVQLAPPSVDLYRPRRMTSPWSCMQPDCVPETPCTTPT
jgi:hypothetical protein